MITKIYKLLPTQIPAFWEAIKFTYIRSNNISEKDVPVYCRELLIALLSGKAISVIGLDENKILVGVLICRVMVERLSNKRYLLLHAVYAWEKLNEDIWLAAFDTFLDFAKLEQCDYITTISPNPKVWDNLEKIGFIEEDRTYTLSLERSN